MTGDRMKILMLTLPFMVRDLITPEVLHYMHVLVCTSMYCVDPGMYLVCTGMYQVELINRAIKTAKKGSRLHGLPPVSDPSNEVVEVLIQCMAWNMATRQSRILESELPELQQKAVDLLDMLQEHLPDKTGKKGKWNFEKAHSILHKVREIVLWGNSDNTSCQAPEVQTWYILVLTWYILICTGSYLVHTQYILSTYVLSARPYRKYQDGGKPYRQQGCVHVHPAFPCSGWIPPDI